MCPIGWATLSPNLLVGPHSVAQFISWATLSINWLGHTLLPAINWLGNTLSPNLLVGQHFVAQSIGWATLCCPIYWLGDTLLLNQWLGNTLSPNQLVERHTVAQSIGWATLSPNQLVGPHSVTRNQLVGQRSVEQSIGWATLCRPINWTTNCSYELAFRLWINSSDIWHHLLI